MISFVYLSIWFLFWNSLFAVNHYWKLKLEGISYKTTAARSYVIDI
jgi:hypothetical protein